MNSIQWQSFERTAIILILLVLLFVIFVLFFKPSFIGFGIKEGENSLAECHGNLSASKSETSLCNIDLSSCERTNSQILKDKEKISSEFYLCDENSEILKLNLTASEKEKTDLKNELNQTKEELKNEKKNYSDLAENLANNLCCKNKIDNPAINYYSVENNKIICLENGEKRLSC